MKTRHNKPKGFWDQEDCEYCGGLLEDRETEMMRRYKGSYVIFRHVPAGVCQRCGTRYFSANVLKIISQKLRHSKVPKKIEVSLLDLSAA